MKSIYFIEDLNSDEKWYVIALSENEAMDMIAEKIYVNGDLQLTWDWKRDVEDAEAVRILDYSEVTRFLNL